jgi:hypothetical protein
MGDLSPLLRAFLHGEIDSGAFRHADHVRVAFEMLRRHAFQDAVQPFCSSLQGIAARAGNPGAYHATVTLAFLSLIAERSASVLHGDFESFASANADLMDKSVLTRWYAPERLASEIARKIFVLPGASR